MKTLNELIKEYIKNKRNICIQEKCLIKASFKNFGEMLKIISMGLITKKDGFKRHPHQRRLKEINLVHFRNKIVKHKKELLKAKSFNELYNIICSCRIGGIGDLAIYDVAFRIGTYLRRYPKYVYLHAGTRKGAIALGLRGSCKFIDKKEFHKPLQRLKAYEIEDLLCIYKNKLRFYK